MKRLTLIACAVAIAGCEEPPTIQLFIDLSTDIVIPDDVDEIEVTIAANSAGARVCRGATRRFDLTSAELPLYIRVVQGTEFDKSIAYWITGRHEELRTLEPYVNWLNWPAEGERDVDVLLEPECLTVNLGATCGDDEHCNGERCVEPVIPIVFRTSSSIQDVSCQADLEE